MPEPELPHRQLGESPIDVSRIALGSWRTLERMPRAGLERGQLERSGAGRRHPRGTESGIPPPCAGQLPYSLVRLDWVEDPAMEAALQEARASPVASATLDGGALTGKYAEGAAGRLSDELAAPRRRRGFAVGRALREPARRLQTTPATLAIAFTLTHPRTASALIGATKPEQVEARIDAVALADRLTDVDLAELRKLAEPTA